MKKYLEHHIIEEEKKLTKALNRNTKVLEEVEYEVASKGSRLLAISKRRYIDYFLQGILYGLGILAAAVIIIPIAIALLRNIQWVPLIGDTVTKVLNRVEETRSPGGGVDYR